MKSLLLFICGWNKHYVSLSLFLILSNQSLFYCSCLCIHVFISITYCNVFFFKGAAELSSLQWLSNDDIYMNEGHLLWKKKNLCKYTELYQLSFFFLPTSYFSEFSLVLIDHFLLIQYVVDRLNCIQVKYTHEKSFFSASSVF
jgi:hypothetical protein